MSPATLSMKTAAEANLPGPQLRLHTVTTLIQSMAKESGWVRIHAAEALATTGEARLARQAFEAIASTLTTEVNRTGIWRVMAWTEPTAADRLPWLERIERVFVNPANPDRPQAIESLNKLRHVVTGTTLLMVRKQAVEGSEEDSILPLWALGVAGEPGAAEQIAKRLASPSPLTRLKAAYALRWLQPTDPAILSRLAAAAKAEPVDTDAYPYVLSAAYASQAEPDSDRKWKAALESLADRAAPGARYEACQALFPRAHAGDIEFFSSLMEDSDGDPRIGAAWALLDILRREAARTG